jgi:hypothetical protein
MWPLAGFLAVMMLLAALRAVQPIISAHQKDSDVGP